MKLGKPLESGKITSFPTKTIVEFTHTKPATKSLLLPASFMELPTTS